MNCEECNLPIKEIKNSIIEWISCEDWALLLFIRLVHPDCCYYQKRREILDDIDANDHWLPLHDIEPLLDIALEMAWDDKKLAESAFIRYITQRNHINGGTNNENNKP